MPLCSNFRKIIFFKNGPAKFFQTNKSFKYEPWITKIHWKWSWALNLTILSMGTAVGTDCFLDAGNQFSASGSYQECPNELYFEVGHSINKFKFSGMVLVVSGCWNLVSSIKNACSTHSLYSMDNMQNCTCVNVKFSDF